MTSGPSLVLALQRENAVKFLLDLLGPNDPQVARRQSQQLWTAVFGVDPIMNGLFGEELCLLRLVYGWFTQASASTQSQRRYSSHLNQ